MKLYKLYNDIILENIKRGLLLFEGVSDSLVDTVLAGDAEKPGKHYRVQIRYKNLKGEVSNQFIEINQRNVSSAGNGLIDARVLSKNNEVMPDNVFKKFRLDGIEDFKVTKVAYYQPAVGFKTDGTNNSKTVASVNNYADYNYQYAQSTLKQKERKANQAAPAQEIPVQNTKPVSKPKSAAKPIQNNPVPTPKPMIGSQPVQKTWNKEPNIEKPEIANDVEDNDDFNL